MVWCFVLLSSLFISLLVKRAGGSRAVAQLMEKIAQENAARAQHEEKASSSPSSDRGSKGSSAVMNGHSKPSTGGKVSDEREEEAKSWL